MPSPSFASRLLRWYSRHGRKLPFRGPRDPYRVWVSEIMLQQTRVETVIPYYRRWMKQFPTVKALASARQTEVLKLWEGLGYYARARNLHRAAKIVLSEHGGRIPESVEGLKKLPGIGRSTAGAIASIAFGDDAPVLDGNVKRVLARVFDVQQAIKSQEGEKELWALAERLVPNGRAGVYNQALMDLGATVCTAKSPACRECPLRTTCLAFALGLQQQRPVVTRRALTPHYDVTAAIIRRNGRVLIARRPADKLLGGLWEFPGGKARPGESLAACLKRELREELGIVVRVRERVAALNHAFSHFRITLHVFECELKRGGPRALQVSDFKWVYPPQLERYPMGKADRTIARRLAKPGVV